MKRKEFINWAGLGLIASCLPIALVACTENNTATEDASNPELLSVGTILQLEETGFLLDEESKVIVVKNSNGKLMAVNPTCTHQGCIVEWKSDDAKFICPCHNAKFAADGKVLAEPAKLPLAIYEVKEENGELRVKIT